MSRITSRRLRSRRCKKLYVSLSGKICPMYGVMLIILGILMLLYNSIYGSGDLDLSFGDMDVLIELWDVNMDIFWKIAYGLYIIGGAVIIRFTWDSLDSEEEKAMTIGTALLTVSIGEIILQNPAGVFGFIIAALILTAEDASYWYYIGWGLGLIAFIVTIIGSFGSIVEAFAMSQTAIFQCVIFLWIAVMNIIAITWFVTDCKPWDIA